MILVTQGHELGIGLEVFLKSILRLPKNVCDNIILYAYKNTLEENLKALNASYKFDNQNLKIFGKVIKIIEPKQQSLPQSTSSLVSAIEDIDNEHDVLLTLPTSKDQLIHEGELRAGYTEFLRSYFKNLNISMIFKGINGFTLLLTDHIALKNVPSAIDSNLVEEKLSTVIKGLDKYFHLPEEFVFTGVNPHAGEGGILGNEESSLKKGISSLSVKFPNLSFKGPLPGDTLHFEVENRNKKVFVYAFHDQALGIFKAQNGLFGINISLGLPFLRLSVDHGTAFHLYGKNIADSSGCLFALEEAYKVISNDNK